MPQKKQTKKIKLRDLKPRKEAKAGVRVAEGGPARQSGVWNFRPR